MIGKVIGKSHAIAAKVAVALSVLTLACGSSVQAADAPQAVTYWIELVRDGQVLHVTQKASFKSGDKIKFHVKPNIESYAYVALKSGSQGESSVLFPLPNSKDNNHLEKGVDIAIPSDDYMTFDQNPGTEHVCLTLSRTPIDAKSLLGGGMRPDDTKVVMRQPGSKDLVPVKIKVSYTTPNSAESASNSDAAHNKKYAPAGISYVPGVSGGHSHLTPAAPPDDGPGEVTVTQSEPGNTLNIDVDLSHAS